MSYKAIGDYGVIGDCHSAALVSLDGSIDWCCFPRFDSPSVFAAILDDEKGGRFSISPRCPGSSRQAYLPGTNILQTFFQTEGGGVTVTDFMPCYATAAGKLQAFHEIHRLVSCPKGEVPLQVLFQPRLDYARATTRLEKTASGVAAGAGEEKIALSSALPFRVEGDRAMAELILRQGETLPLVLRYGEAAPQAPETYLSAEKLKRTEDYWKGLARACTYRGPWREMVERSYLALHLLLYAPTGAIVAAPTTSLPEEIGGERNWDYRFTWLRDSSFVLNAFFSLGHAEEAEGFMNWLSTLCDRCGATAQILYAVDFEQNLQEEVLSHLSGYRGSRPVRIGNGAYRQLQLDVFGEVLSSAYMYLTQGGEISPRIWGLLESFVEAAAENWRRPDSGIWEVRSGPYHFVHSKVMCWVALDRGIRIAARLGYGGDLERWRRIAEEIRQDILTRGWKEQKQAFTQHYESEALDASNLLMPLFGFLPATDERMKSTIERSMAELTWRGLVRRYNTEEVDDGLTGGEAAFALCTFWLIRNLIRLGRLSEARALYERMLGYANHLGLFAEMVQPETGELLGNFPQAFTHVAVIITGLELTRALSRENQL